MITFVPGRIWIEERPQRFFGFPMGTRMTVIKLNAGGLFVHSPVTPDEAVEMLIAREGDVRFVIAPNRLHHLYLTPFLAAHPGAELWIVEELVRKRHDLSPTGVLGNAPEAGWADEIDQCLFAGSMFQNEAIFLDKPSGTLIVVDLLESVHRSDPWYYRLVGRLLGTFERPGLTRDQRLCFRDREAARASAERILGWEFDRIVLAHGQLIERGGKAVFADAMRWLTG
jgi:Domain of unknown function (DUF4336)